MLSGLKGYK
ncbi:ribosomal protein L29, partial [Chlamydia psittaci C1/97]